MTKRSQSTREIILDALSHSKELTSRDLSLVCGIGEPAVRFHLRKLKEAGLVKENPTGNSIIKAGRKSHVYQKILQEKTGNVDDLCCALLKLFVETHSDSENEITQTIAKGLLGAQTIPKKHGASLLVGLIGWLNQHQYAARWEAGKLGPVIRFQNCPYRSILTENDILCKIDCEILQKMSGFLWEQKEQLNSETLAGECVFIVKQAA